MRAALHLLALALLLLAAAAPARGEAPPPPAADRAEAEAWSVVLEVPAPLRPGAPAVASLRLTARAGNHVNLDYPASFRPAADATVAFAGARVALSPADRVACAGHAEETCTVRWPLPFTAADTARARVAGTLAFSVCSAERCLIERVVLGAGPR